MGALTLWKPTWFWISKVWITGWSLKIQKCLIPGECCIWDDTKKLFWKKICLDLEVVIAYVPFCRIQQDNHLSGSKRYSTAPPVNAYMDVRKSTSMLPMLLHSEMSCHRLFSRVPAIQWSLLSRWQFWRGPVVKQTQNITVLVSYNKNEIMFNPWDIMISQSHCEP